MDAVSGRVASAGRHAKPPQAWRARGWSAICPSRPGPRGRRQLFGLFAGCSLYGIADRDFAPAKPALSRGCGILFS